MNYAFEPLRGLITVPASIVGPAGRSRLLLALDTGANRTLVRIESVTAAGFGPDLASLEAQLTTASGVGTAPILEIDRFESLGLTRRSFPVVCFDLQPSPPVNGLLGLDFFRDTRLCIDFRAALITVE